MRLRCKIGIHRWKYTRRPTFQQDAFPTPFDTYEAPVRWCKWCNQQQRWLPGYGGSEMGCWLKVFS